MIGVQNFLGLQNVNFTARGFCPRQNRKPLDVVAGHAIVGGHGRHARQAAQLFQCLFLDFVGHARAFDLLTQFFGIALAFILLAQFLLDGLHLLAQVVLALALLDAVLNF